MEPSHATSHLVWTCLVACLWGGTPTMKSSNEIHLFGSKSFEQHSFLTGWAVSCGKTIKPRACLRISKQLRQPEVHTRWFFHSVSSSSLSFCVCVCVLWDLWPRCLLLVWIWRRCQNNKCRVGSTQVLPNAWNAKFLEHRETVLRFHFVLESYIG